jgi:phospholipase C
MKSKSMKMKMSLLFAGASVLAVCLFLSAGCATQTATTSNTTPGVAVYAPPVAPPAMPPASRIALKFVKADSEETAGEDGKGANAVDGDPNTIWHTQWQDASPEHPHEIVIELTPPSTIKGFTYLPRQDDSENGTIEKYEFNVSNDGQDFGQPLAKGEFANSKDLKTVTFNPRACRFIKLKALSEVNGGAWTSAAEIGVIAQ